MRGGNRCVKRARNFMGQDAAPKAKESIWRCPRQVARGNILALSMNAVASMARRRARLVRLTMVGGMLLLRKARP